MDGEGGELETERRGEVQYTIHSLQSVDVRTKSAAAYAESFIIHGNLADSALLYSYNTTVFVGQM